jgi:hypothetical protein
MPPELFNVWVADDQIAAAVGEKLHRDYNKDRPPSLLIASFIEAGAACNAAFALQKIGEPNSESSALSLLPDIAVIDLNFNENEPFLQGPFDHIRETEVRETVESKAAKNAAGFWVAKEILETAARLNRKQPLLQLYTANPDVVKNLGWAVAESKLCHKPFLEVECKHNDPDEIVRLIENLLLQAERDRVRSSPLPPEVLTLCLGLREFAAKRKHKLNSDQVSLALEKLRKSAEHLAQECSKCLRQERRNDMRRLQRFPLALLGMNPSPRDIDVAINNDEYAKEADYEEAGLLSEWISLKQSFNQYNAELARCLATNEEYEEFDGLKRQAVEVPLRHFFPNVSRFVFLEDAINHHEDILKQVQEALKIACEGDYHWSLCRALKSVRITPDSLPVPSTKLAAATHNDGWREIGEADLQDELNSSSLPELTKRHLREGMPIIKGDQGVPDPNAEPLRSLGWSFCRGAIDTKHMNWIHKWKTLRSPAYPPLQGILDAERVYLADDVAEDEFLTDWRLFFFGSDSMLWKLRNELPGRPPLSLGVSSGELQGQIRVIIRAFLNEPLKSAPGGGILEALGRVRCWGTAHWEATTKSGKVTCNIWPHGDPTPVSAAGDDSEPYFLVEWKFMNYLQTRYL